MIPRVLRLGAAAAVGLLAAAVLFLLWPAPPEPLPADATRRRPVAPITLKAAPAPAEVEGRRSAPVPSLAPRLPPRPGRQRVLGVKQKPASWDPDGDLLGQVDALMGRPFEPPAQVDDPQLAANRGFWRRNQELQKLESRLLARIEADVSPYETFEARVALAQVYRNQAEVLGMGRAPEQWHPSRAENWQQRMDEAVATSADKAAMMFDMLERSAGSWPADDPAVQRLNDLR